MLGTHRGSISWVSTILLAIGVILIGYAAVAVGPQLDSGGASGWWALGIGAVFAVVSPYLYIIGISLRHTTTSEVVASVAIAALFFISYLVWTTPVSDPVIFRPALINFGCAVLWLGSTIFCAFRRGSRVGIKI